MSDERKLKLSDFDKNRSNPFVEQAIEKINNNVVKKYRTASKTGEKAVLKAIDESTGEVLGHTQFIRQIEVDEEQFTKLYLSNFSAFFDLSPAAIKVFGYIMTTLKPKNDTFLFVMEECLDYTGYKTKKPIYRGLADLVSAGIIARGFSDILYFINPMVVFNGDRITFAKSYVRKRKDAVDPNQQAIDFGPGEIEG